MARLEAIGFLNELEHRYDVNAMLHNGIRIWPLLRMKIGEHLVADAPPGSLFGGSSAPTALAKVWQLIKGIPTLLPWHRHLERTDLLFYSMNRHRENWGGFTHDRYCDPLVKAAGELGLRSTIVEHLEFAPITAPWTVPCSRFDSSPALMLLAGLHARRRKPDPRTIPDLEALLAHVATVDHGPSLGYIASQLHDLDLYVRLHSRLLREARPRCVFRVCWYAVDSMAVQHVCHTMGIRCVDLQHGVQGKGHLAYGRWAVLPSTGYSSMPDVFWCWDKESADNIASWAGGSPIKALTLGDPWMEEAPAEMMAPVWKDDGRLRVLYTAFLPDVIPRIALEALHATHTTCQWVFRTHPGMPRLPGLMADLLKAEGLFDRAVISPASGTPLVLALQGCHLHITQYSSVILEAARQGVPSVAIHHNAADLFTDTLASGALHMALTLDDLLVHLRSPQRFTPIGNEQPPIVERLRGILDGLLPAAR
ncbi:MAG: hypothetical protein ABI599_10375 [Flavobacteriales bacterium]